ncbi:MAG: DHA2 family efflux MFS transporter permease subunit [Hyphomicrobiaceae bacterium]|nr:MAG: DHA2 family efflux MFS transporter permease subunit [Hyphomicrobiaceae bacterium]
MSDEPLYQLTFTQRVLVLVTIVLSCTIYAGSVLISSALLPQLQGALSATQDEVSWVMTFNIVATAVATPATGWLADRFGQRATMIWSALVFALSTFMCGASNSLNELIFWRIVQGAAGAPLVPLGQTILLDSFPRSQHSTVISVFGMANMIGPSLGPMFAGQIAETLGWRWGFWMVVPVAVAAVIGCMLTLPRDEKVREARLDWLGFISLSAGIAAAQLVFSRGQRLDWFDSSEIAIATFVACLAIYIFCAHSLTSERPFVRLKLFADRNYALGLTLVTLFGMLNFATIVLLPPLLQQHAGYPDSAVGEIVGWRGIGSTIGFFLAMPMARLDPRASLVIGGLLQSATGLWMMSFDLNVDMTTLVLSNALQGLSIGVSWVPLTVITFWTLPAQYRAEAMSVFHLFRNFGSSFFISVAVAEIVRTQTANYARLVEQVSPYNRVLEMPWAMGAWSVDTLTGLARLSGEIARQSIMIGYKNAFLLYTFVAVASIALCLLARLPKTKTPP